MRVTNKLMADTITSNLFKNTERLLDIQNTIASGKRINKPSDDPVGMGKVLDYRKTISIIDQYNRNIGHAQSWLGLADSALSSVDELLIRAKELAVSQATETASEETRLIAAEEMKNIYDQIIQLANTKSGNSYIFAGHITDTTPFTRNADGIEGTADDFDAVYHGDTGEISIIIGEDVDIKINENGEAIFQNAASGGENIFDTLRDLIAGLEADDTAAISDQIEPLDDALDQILGIRANVGAKMNRLEITENYWAEFQLNVSKMLSDTEDADMTKAITDLTTQEAVYQASLAVAARVIQPTLVDFLR